MAGIGLAKKGLGLLGKKQRGNFAMKNFKKRLQKTPNNVFKDKVSGKEQKKKILEQQHRIKRNWEATGDEWGPFKGGWR